MEKGCQVLVAAALAFVFPSLSHGQGSAAGTLCFEQDEILADVLYQFMLSQGFVAMRCDALTLEENAAKGGGPFFKLHAGITKTHAAKLDELVSLEVLRREKFGGLYKEPGESPRFGTQMITAVTFSATPAKCSAFMAELQKRSESFDYLRTRVLGEYASERTRYPPCE